MSVLVSVGKFCKCFDILSKILVCFSFLTLGLKPMESKLAVLISDLAPFSHFFKQQDFVI